MHTFVFLSCLMGFWLLLSPMAVKKEVATIGVYSFVPASFLILNMTSFFSGFSIVHLAPGWVQGKQNFFYFWLYNFGLFLPLGILAFGIVLHTVLRDSRRLTFLDNAARSFVIPSVLLFLLFCFVMMHPNNWDNIKMFLWSYIILLPFIYKLLLQRRGVWLRGIAGIVLFLSGAADLMYSLSNSGWELFNRAEVDGIREATRKIPVDKTFAGYYAGNNPLLLAGRKAVLGYPGHIWVHGFDSGLVQARLARLLSGEVGWEAAAKELDVKYLFWGRFEREHYPASQKPWERSVPVLASGSWGTIYDFSSITGQ
jgi:hypothetical protein